MPKIRDSGMPAEQNWEGFFDPPAVLEALGCKGIHGDALEFGCGYGTFTVPLARQVSGLVYALDIDPLMVAATAARVATLGLDNVCTEERDFVLQGSGRPPQSISFVVLFNILHAEDPLALLRETQRVLHPRGTAGVIHWTLECDTPRGPPRALRPTPEQCGQWAEAAGLAHVRAGNVPGAPWHWGMVLERPGDKPGTR